MEIFKDISGYEGYYQISNMGRLKSLGRCEKTKNGREYIFNKSERFLSPNAATHRYKIVSLVKDGNIRQFTIHRLVAQAFVPKTEKKINVNHINGNKADNRAINLEWVTCQENITHACNTGLRDSKGEKNPTAVLTEIQVLEIRKNTSQLKQSELAKMFGVNRACISKIILRRTWKSI